MSEQTNRVVLKSNFSHFVTLLQFESLPDCQCHFLLVSFTWTSVLAPLLAFKVLSKQCVSSLLLFT